jgi:hypothetical protein
MRKRFALTALAALALSAQAARGEARPGPRRLTLLYLADLGGNLEPCGCSRNQRGGLPRLAAAVARIRSENPETVLVAGGDLLFEFPLEPEQRSQELAKARAAAEALRRMGLFASVVGERDRLAGEEFLRSTGLPFTRAARSGPLGFGDLEHVPQAQVRVAVVQSGGTREAQALAAEARRRGVHLLLAAHRGSLLADDVNRAVLDGPVPVAQVQGRGQSLLRVDFLIQGDPAKGFAVLPGAAQREQELDLSAERRAEYARRRAEAEAAGNLALARALEGKLAELQAREKALREAPLPAPPTDRPSMTIGYLAIADSLPEDPAVRAILTRTYGEVARENLAQARSARRPCPDPERDAPAFTGLDDPPRGGTFACRTCHAAAAAFWERTPHARAYETLAKAGRQYDLDCIRCHVTGWKEPGGPCTVADTEGRRDVQCEACHGPSSLHALDPPGHLRRAVAASVCQGCHTAEASTAFDDGRYRERVIGPGHGARP